MNGTSSAIKWDGAFNIGTVINIVVLIVALSLGWSAFDKRLTLIEHDHNEMLHKVQAIDARTERLDRFMLSHEPSYANISPSPKQEENIDSR